ncbi:AlwI family type II restriction endonuclease [Sphingobacterium shayense]|uniref:AlwI family type II restriction endonuclease n=1 Tax=Sphingobacterium shayense TaxID=626343 RepID=UPI001555968B|nr:AlwI family type II restriction endonuclease [Sphingobacterium shayense]NQD69987.1 AlwI family type II restriction endonuclease [Sphingobacterium shayense]
MNIEFDPNNRRSWMFPRNIRKIYPWKLAQICQILDQLSLNDWSQEAQNEFSRMLTSGNLKGQNEIRDPKSGGARTYISQLESLGLLYRTDKSIRFTLAGKSLINFETPLKVLQVQLLNYQYPSVYSSGRNVRIHPGLKIKPFVFVLKMLKDSHINYLTVEELVFFVLYGHNLNCGRRILDKIDSYRTALGSRANLLKFIDDPEKDLYTPKASDKSNFTKLLDEALNVANTFKNYLVCSSLVYEMPGSKHIVMSNEFSEIIKAGIADANNFIPYSSGLAENFTRTYGAWDRKKDTSPTIERKKLTKGEAIISSQFYEHIGNNIMLDDAEEFIKKMRTDFGFTREQTLGVISPLLPKSLTFFESKYLELAKGGVATARAFEKATVELFEKRLGIKALHTGNRYKNGVGGYSDIILSNFKTNECAIADTKASSFYTLPSADYAKMISNYIPNYKLIEEVKDARLGFILYITGELGGEIQTKLLTLYKDSGYPVSAINAKTLIEVAQLNDVQTREIWDVFKYTKVLHISDFQ